jgi:hypothetical protein
MHTFTTSDAKAIRNLQIKNVYEEKLLTRLVSDVRQIKLRTCWRVCAHILLYVNLLYVRIQYLRI